MRTIPFEPMCGMDIRHACTKSVQLAKTNRARVPFWFNGIKLVATPKTSPYTLQWTFWNVIGQHGSRYRATKAAHEEAQVDKRKMQERQQEVYRQMLYLPQQASTHDGMMQWLLKFVPLADYIGIQFDAPTIIERMEARGYVENQHVGQPKEFFNERTVTAQYIAGQVLNCLKRGMPPHPIAATFCEKYFQLPTL